MDVAIKLSHVAIPGEAVCKENEASPTKRQSLQLEQHEPQRIHLATAEDEQSPGTHENSIFHVYSQKEVHKCLSQIEDPTRERRSGPKPKERKLERKQKKRERTEVDLGPDNYDEDGFYLHRPYLAFHVPPRVLYQGRSRHAKPVVLIHAGPFWRWYKLQLGPSLTQHSVLDGRGVVSWRNNGGDRKALKGDDHLLKGYKVRTWRLWGEHGKHYVQTVKTIRQISGGQDPDVLGEGDLKEEPAKADHVVYLCWTKPLSTQTRRYHFHHAGIDFVWKGTGSVKENRRCGFVLRYNHLKLVAKVPLVPNGKDKGDREHAEVCLCKYTSSVNAEKNGKLEVFDDAILRLGREHTPLILVDNPKDILIEAAVLSREQQEVEEMKRLKGSTLYHVIVATAMCMLMSEKEKRHTLLTLLEHAGEGGG